MAYNLQNPLIVQSDRTVLLEVNNDLYTQARDELARFAELEKSPEHIHTYRITPISLWNAASAGITAEEVTEGLERFSKYDVPGNIKIEIADQMSRYGRVKLERIDGELMLTSDDALLLTEIWNNNAVQPFLQSQIDAGRLLIYPHLRGHVKQALIKVGFPVEDLAGYVTGAYLDIALQSHTRSGEKFAVRKYQSEAGDVFYDEGSERGGSGVIVLPCGAGKTVVGMTVMSKLKTQTLILTTSITALRQWREELLDKTNLQEEEIGEYSGEQKETKPVTLTTYQTITWRRKRGECFPHFELFSKMDWGLIVYDEVHLLPAPVFRITAEIQARRRLGLTATLVREDGKEDDVFSLIGPKKYDVPWKVLEKQGWIAAATCTEVRIVLPETERVQYAVADSREQFRIASENPAKLNIVHKLLDRHDGDLVLIIGQYIRQLEAIAANIGAPIITGKTPNRDRKKLYHEFRTGKTRRLVVSKVGNFAVDLPDANVAIQVSGTFGSRQEEAQRLGRILRPKSDNSPAHFYALVTRDTRDQDFAANRQLFLTEQGYSYEIRDEHEIG